MISIKALPVIGAYRFRGGELLVPNSVDDAAATGPLVVDNGDFSTTSALLPVLDYSATLRLYLESDKAPFPVGWRSLSCRTAWAAANTALRNGVHTGTKAGLEAASPYMSLGGEPEGEGASVFLRACHASRWLGESLYCGRCGQSNGLADDEFARVCPACGRREYPRISPAVIVLIEDAEGRVLLARNRKFSGGVFSLIAGFVEAGENLEAAVRRETAEETGVVLSNIRYDGSQPWPFPNSLMVAFRALWSAGTARPDGEEIVELGWFKPGDLPPLPLPGSVARAMIERWIKERAGR